MELIILPTNLTSLVQLSKWLQYPPKGQTSNLGPPFIPSLCHLCYLIYHQILTVLPPHIVHLCSLLYKPTTTTLLQPLLSHTWVTAQPPHQTPCFLSGPLPTHLPHSSHSDHSKEEFWTYHILLQLVLTSLRMKSMLIIASPTRPLLMWSCQSL